MSNPATILVPVDFSPCSRSAMECACVLARACNAQIRLLHALQLPPVTVDSIISDSLFSDLRESERVRFETFRSAFAERGVSVSSCFEEGNPTHAIRDAAAVPDVELIVMGSHGRHGLDRLVLGSVAERTLQGASVPVLIVREDEYSAARPIGSILFATDFSENAEQTEQIIARWARLLGSEIEVFHAIREPGVPFGLNSFAGSSDFGGQMREAAACRIETVLERFRRTGVSAKSKIVYGSAAQRIIERAETIGAQMIAMGSCGHSALQRFLLGSVAQRVLRRAPCSVLVAGSPRVNPSP